jgi:hypothetical protein
MTTRPIRDKNHSHLNRNSTSYCALYMNGIAANPIARLSGLIFRRHGEPTGGDFMVLRLTEWIQGVLHVWDNATSGPQVLASRRLLQLRLDCTARGASST